MRLGTPAIATDMVETTLRHAAQLLPAQPDLALAQARKILSMVPHHPHAALIQGQALRRLGKPKAALPHLAALASVQPRVPAVLWELAQAASEAGDGRQAIVALESLTRQQPGVAGGWFLLAKELRKLARTQDAWRADLSGVIASSRDPELLDAAVAMNEGRLDEGEAILTARLQHRTDDPPACRLMGEIIWRRGDMSQALTWVERAVHQAPGFDLARDFLIRLLVQNNRLPEALEHAEILNGSPMKSPGHDLIMASVLVRLGDQARARGIYESLLAQRPDQPQLWQNLGHVLKTLGKQAEAIHAYRQAVTQQPAMGEAWWSLANLKTVTLGADDITAMEQALGRVDKRVSQTA